ncbi:MAG: choline-sulfatase [Geminicoccaceae bacterium]
MSLPARPNVLVVMADQLTPLALPFHADVPTKAPHMAALAAEGVVFDAAYCNSPLCAPARAVLMTGRLPSAIGAFDNAAELPAELPTFAHALRLGGYRTILSGKMHFCGADQLHGFEERLTTDIYPADFGWTPDWDRPAERQEWYHNMSSVLEAGTCVRTNQLDFDDEVVFAAERRLFELVREPDRRPFLMVVSMTHPHDPFAIPAAYWDRYDPAEIPLPRVTLAEEAMDPHARRVRAAVELDRTPPTPAQIRAARHAYYGAISYVDDQLGRLRQALATTGLAESTVIVLLSDHGEMLGERGLWYKMTFFEGAARIPLVVHAPGRLAPRRVAQAVSAADLLPTFLDLTGTPPLPTPIEGRSLMPHLLGRPGHDEVFGEYLAEAALAPIVMIRRGRHKFVHSPADPDLLFDLAADPDELVNLASRPEAAALVAELRAEVAARWDLAALHRTVLESQRRRRFVFAALAEGARTHWDYQPVADASRRYVRSHLPLDTIEAQARFPRP